MRTAWPALIGVVTDLTGTITGVQRTWLDPTASDKAPIITPRRAMGDLLGHGVRFGRPADAMAAGEGIETMLSLRQVAPNLRTVAALSAAHLAALILPPTCKRLYIAEDADPAGRNGADQLASRAEAAGVEALRLRPTLGDLNEDLVHLGIEALTLALRTQFAPEDVGRFLVIDGGPASGYAPRRAARPIGPCAG